MTRWLLILVLWACAASASAAAPQHEQVRQVMGTLATVKIWAADATLAQAAADSAFAIFAAVDSLMSTWNGHSPLSRLNQAPTGSWVPVGAEVCQVLTVALAVAEQTGGAFDPTVLPLVKLWGFRGGQPAVPDSAALATVLAGVDAQGLEVGPDRARLLLPGMGVDLGGIAKGHALDRAAAALIGLGVQGGVLDLGGNLLVFGEGPGREVGIVDPLAPESLIATVPLVGRAVATSGQYERFVTAGGRAYGHILDPRTGWPVPAGISVTVMSDEAILADALATAVVVLGADAGLDLLEKLPGVEGVIVDQDDVRWTTGIPLLNLPE